ncbi:hypothetical protein CFP56_037850 [Quercus suber]|uniref:Uncharacterized protein n=1 Tax=Quercus suber TaxID=58331 RepID=A0AAW0J3J6_QUESU
MATKDFNSNDERGRLYRAALNGDWKSIKDIQKIQRKITKKGETTLHIAAAANQEEFRESSRVDDKEQAKYLSHCVRGGLYGVALQMLEDNSNLAAAGNSDGETALHVLARDPSAFVSEIRPCEPKKDVKIDNSGGLKLKQENSKQSQVNELFEKCLQAYRDDVENLNEISVISHVLFDAVEVGNTEFLVKLIRFDFDLLWKTRNSKSIFHIAVEKRHESIFNILNEIGSIGDLNTNYS